MKFSRRNLVYSCAQQEIIFYIFLLLLLGTSKVDERRKSLHPATKLDSINVAFDPHEIKSHIALQPEKHEVMAAIDEFICTKEVSFTMIPQADANQTKSFCNKGIQTDPRRDPLGAWSKVCL